MAEPKVDLDLDALSRPPLHVKLGDAVWKLPGGPQSELVVDMAALFEKFDEALRSGEQELMQERSAELRDMFEELFGVHHSTEELEELPRLGDEDMAALFGLLVKQITEREGAADGSAERPTKSTAASSRSGRRSRPNTRRRTGSAKRKAPSGS